MALASASTAKSACRKGHTSHKNCLQKHTRPNALKPYLLFGLGLLHILSTHFNPGSEDGPGELQHVDAEQMAQFLSSCVIRHGRLVVVLLLHKGNVPKLEHSRDHLKHGYREREGNIHQGRLCAQKNEPLGPSFTYVLFWREAHDCHGVHGLGEVLRIALARNRDGPTGEKAILINTS